MPSPIVFLTRRARPAGVASRGKMSRRLMVVVGLLAIAVVAFAARQWEPAMRAVRTTTSRDPQLRAWLADPASHPSWSVRAGQQCPGAPFLMPTTGYIGYLWDDSFRPGHRHEGIDIFGGTEAGVTPVAAAYPGFLTRRADWVSTVAIRIPRDPLNPGRQVWTYYTHMATTDGRSLVAPEFPPGSHDVSVAAGTFLGNQGDYSGDPSNPVAVHLHFSVVLSDALGGILNESDIANTVDPLPYLGMEPSGGATVDALAKCLQGQE
jgi:peptidoglycan LD-endopeptidase LytH